MLPVHPDVLDHPQVWRSNPEQAFASWLMTQQLRNSSRTVYLAMFTKFCRWLTARKLELADVQFSDISAFLDGSGLTKHHRYRYVRLMERAYDHLAALGVEVGNPGRKAALERVGHGRNDPTRFLSLDERQRLIGFIAAQRPIFQARRDDPDGWIEIRDLALTAVILGGGVKVREACALTVNCIDLIEEKIHLPRRGKDPEHRARLIPFAQEVLAEWLPVRRTLTIPGDRGTLLFPANRTPRGFAPKDGSLKLHPSSIFRRTQQLMLAAGVSGERTSGQTLRNTYAAMLFDEGQPDALILEYLGMQAMVSVQRLRASYQDFAQRTGSEST